MAIQDDLTIVAQMPDQKDLQPGIHESVNQVIGLQPEIGLIAISTNPTSSESSPARITMEILMDDMQTNIHSLNLNWTMQIWRPWELTVFRSRWKTLMNIFTSKRPPDLTRPNLPSSTSPHYST